MARTLKDLEREIASVNNATDAFNAMIGNGDAHSKKYSLTIDSAALVDVAPLYDLAPVMFLGQFTHAGHAVAGQADLRYITRQHLLDEAVSWGMKRSVADAVIEGVTHRVLDAIDSTFVSTDLETIAELVRDRVRSFCRASGSR